MIRECSTDQHRIQAVSHDRSPHPVWQKPHAASHSSSFSRPPSRSRHCKGTERTVSWLIVGRSKTLSLPGVPTYPFSGGVYDFSQALRGVRVLALSLWLSGCHLAPLGAAVT